MYSGKIFWSLTTSHNFLKNSQSLSFSFSLCLDSNRFWSLTYSSRITHCDFTHSSCCIRCEYNNRVVIIPVVETLNNTATHSWKSMRSSSTLVNEPHKMIATRVIITIVNTIRRQSFLLEFLFEFIQFSFMVQR